MGAELVGLHMPAVVTFEDLALMNVADSNGHRYETSPDGVLSVTPLPDSEHAAIASRILAWFILAGRPPEQILQVPGVRVPGPDGVGGRIPDLTVWRQPPPKAVWLTVAQLLLIVEIVSPGSETMDEVTKRREYEQAGIPQYRVVDRDTAQTVTLWRLDTAGAYVERAKMPLAWLLQTSPEDHVSR